jgi:hypothetical protein
MEANPVRWAGRRGAGWLGLGGVRAAGRALLLADQLLCEVLVCREYSGNFTLRRGVG